MSEKFRKFGKNMLALFIGISIGLLILESFLHLYNPFPSRFRGNKIQLKTNFKKQILIDPKIEGLDSVIYYSVNKLGFRGEEKPENFGELYSIITIGGSTTECSLLDDSKTWTAQLGKKLKKNHPGIWINNAGMDGATTYGHSILLDDYVLKLKPKMVVFLIGINDRGRKDFSNEDGNLIDRRESFFRKLVKKSEVANLANNLYLMYRTHKVNIGHILNNNKPIAVPDSGTAVKIDSVKLEELLRPYRKDVPQYTERVRLLATKCLKNNIRPVFVTQPLVYGGDYWELMELYNKAVISVCKELNVECIDLANELKKDPHYFYDEMHYTNQGADSVASIIYRRLNNVVNKK